jgi:GDP/UDP-N,N'-diacetylbacillosamine 2-epimerase (hydrolysing)
MRRTICVVTGSRADYGMLRWVMEEVQGRADLQLQVIVTGMHLSPEFGLTYQEVEKDGFTIDLKVETLLSSDTPTGITKSIGLGMIGFADALIRLKPDFIVLLGDRYEVLAAATAAMVARIPIAHIHGGEATEGLIDEAIRHAVTKMSLLHFVSTDVYRHRVIQLGEDPTRVHTVGALGLDSLARTRLMSRSELELSLGIKFRQKNLLVTFHPITLGNNQGSSELAALLSALSEFPDVGLIFTLPNADTDGRQLIRMVEDYVATHTNSSCFVSLGQLRYLSCMSIVDGVVGNSSSGLIEAPSLRIGTINIGDRQAGRIRAANVIDCEATKDDIHRALGILFSPRFRSRLIDIRNPYGMPGASKKIAATLATVSISGALKKRFFNVDFSCE